MMDAAERGDEPPAAFAIAAAVEDAIAALSSELGRGVTVDLPTTLPRVTGHRQRFTLAMINLLRNAAQSVQTRPLEVRVSAAPDENTGSLQVTVEDNGPGIPPEHRSIIFEPGVSLRPGGTGQGLALVREIVESEMGGTVSCCDGAEMGGARFVLILPIGERAQE